MINNHLNIKRTLTYLSLTAAVLMIVYVAFSSYRSNKDRLFLKLKNQLQNEQFDALYDDSSDLIRSSMTKEQFAERMKIASSMMKKLDPDLKFERDLKRERNETPEGEEKRYGYLFTLQILSNKNESASVVVFWDDAGLFPKFNNLLITQAGYADTKDLGNYEFKGVSNKQ